MHYVVVELPKPFQPLTLFVSDDSDIRLAVRERLELPLCCGLDLFTTGVVTDSGCPIYGVRIDKVNVIEPEFPEVQVSASLPRFVFCPVKANMFDTVGGILAAMGIPRTCVERVRLYDRLQRRLREVELDVPLVTYRSFGDMYRFKRVTFEVDGCLPSAIVKPARVGRMSETKGGRPHLHGCK